MKFGAHLPVMDFGDQPFTLAHLLEYASTARRLGLEMLCANDHVVFDVAWLDGPSALAAALDASGDMTLATTVALAAVRGPVVAAKSLAALDRLSGGRVVAAVGPGSSAADYRSVGLDFDERWARLDEAVRVLRVLWGRDAEPFVGRFYSTEGIELLPLPTQPGGPPIWIGSWGSDTGLQRVARLGDGWLASAYNTTPDLFADAWTRLGEHLTGQGKDPGTFPNGLATMWFYITDDRSDADRILRGRVLRAVHRPEDVLRDRLPIGPAAAFVERLTAFQDAGVKYVMVWPVADECRQLELFCERVVSEMAG